MDIGRAGFGTVVRSRHLLAWNLELETSSTPSVIRVPQDGYYHFCGPGLLGELSARSINFLIHKISKPTPLDVEGRLCWVLLRAQVIIDEAIGRAVVRSQSELCSSSCTCSEKPCIKAITSSTTSGANLNTRRTRKIRSITRHSSSSSKVSALKAFNSMHLQMANCMFGRQMEAEFVSFLLQPQPHGADKELHVLAIVGPSQESRSIRRYLPSS
ncbi:hypothetical protein BS78_08G069000 [Paspalum vaginatum]|nr:hypothetical protein BS78_08G069000 [Paspalum vaginatum]